MSDFQLTVRKYQAEEIALSNLNRQTVTCIYIADTKGGKCTLSFKFCFRSNWRLYMMSNDAQELVDMEECMFCRGMF